MPLLINRMSFQPTLGLLATRTDLHVCLSCETSLSTAVNVVDDDGWDIAACSLYRAAGQFAACKRKCLELCVLIGTQQFEGHQLEVVRGHKLGQNFENCMRCWGR